MTKGDKNDGRDAQGRFTKGNPGGPGGSRKQAFVLRRAAEQALSPEHIAGMIRRAARMALEGNLSAMRLVLDRVCGRAAEAPKDADPLPIKVSRLDTAADCNRAIGKLIDGIVEGVIDRDAARLLIDAVQVRIKALEANELEERLAELEQAAQHTVGRRP